MALRTKLIPFLLFLPLATSAFSQENFAWQLGYPATATLDQFSTSVDVDPQGNAYMLHAVCPNNADVTTGASATLHLSKVSPAAQTIFDLILFRGSPTLALDYAQVIISKGTPTVAPCITVIQSNYNPIANTNSEESIFVDQYDLAGHPLWSAPVMIPSPPDHQPILDNYDPYSNSVGPDATTYLSYKDISTGRYIATVSHSGVVTTNLKLPYNYVFQTQHLINGNWLVTGAPYGIAYWSVINAAGKVQFSSPKPGPNGNGFSPRGLPNGNILSVEGISTVPNSTTPDESHKCTLYSPTGTIIATSATLNGGVAEIFTDSSGDHIYLSGVDSFSNQDHPVYIESITPALAQNWHKDINAFMSPTECTDSGGVFAATYITAGNTPASITISHYDFAGNVDWQKIYTPPNDKAQILCAASNGSQTYFTVRASAFSPPATYTSYFDLVRLVRDSSTSALP
jgi:hypothetical protein